MTESNHTVGKPVTLAGILKLALGALRHADTPILQRVKQQHSALLTSVQSWQIDPKLFSMASAF